MQQNNIHIKKFISFTHQVLNHVFNSKMVKNTILNKNNMELLIKITVIEKFTSQCLNQNTLKNYSQINYVYNKV